MFAEFGWRATPLPRAIDEYMAWLRAEAAAEAVEAAVEAADAADAADAEVVEAEATAK